MVSVDSTSSAPFPEFGRPIKPDSLVMSQAVRLEVESGSTKGSATVDNKGLLRIGGDFMITEDFLRFTINLAVSQRSHLFDQLFTAHATATRTPYPFRSVFDCMLRGSSMIRR